MTKLIEEDMFDYLNFNSNVEMGAKFAVPNEIFSDFQSHLKFSKCAYAYTYYFLSMYLHLYAKYGTEDSIDKFTAKNIQRMLGISPTSQVMNPVTKRFGLLDSLGYTSTETDYPVSLLRLEHKDKEMYVHHYMYSDEKRDFPDRFTHSRNFTVKHPDKMYWRTMEDKEDSYKSGTMNEADSTHMIPLEMLFHALNFEDIMTKGFYVYGFIIYKFDKSRKRGWQIPMDLFQEDIGLTRNTLTKILKALEKHNFIKVKRRKGANGMDLPNTYFPNLHPSRVVYPT